jgi:hypothetical protein
MRPSPEERPIDLRAIDPDRDPLAEERLVARVMARVATSRLVPPDVLSGAWSLHRPLAYAASALILIGLAFGNLRPPARTGTPATVAEALGVPPEFLARWQRGGGR